MSDEIKKLGTPGNLKLEIERYFETCIKREWVITQDDNGVDYKKQLISRTRPWKAKEIAIFLGVHRMTLVHARASCSKLASVIDDARAKGTYTGVRVKWTRTKWPPGTKHRAKKLSGTPIVYNTPDEFREHVEEYFEQCLDRSFVMSEDGDGNEFRREVVRQIKPFTMTGLNVWLGHNATFIHSMKERGDGFKVVVDYARSRCEAFAEEFLFSGKSATGAIFSLKNNYGWVDTHKQEISGAGGGPVAITGSDESAKQAREALLLLANCGGTP